jgi:hypothetical protein
MNVRRWITGTLVVALALGCAAAVLAGKHGEGGPDAVVVQHILIGFRKTLPGKKLDRTKNEARELAESLFARAKDGEDFDALVKEYSDDAYPGVLLITNHGAPLRAHAHTRDGLAISFGDVAFGLEVGEIGMAEYNGVKSPFGWHIIKRIE